MAGLSQPGEWVDGFLFVGNQLALDFLNTRPILNGEARELFSNAAALERWLVASGIVVSPRQRAVARSWRDSREAQTFLKELIGFRERLRGAVLRIESGRTLDEDFLAEVNRLLRHYPQRVKVVKQGSKVVSQLFFDLRNPEDLWAPIAAAAAQLLSEVDPSRVRKCESQSCVVHFFDTSKKGGRRWCSMNICGNRLKVAAYQKRRSKENGGGGGS